MCSTIGTLVLLFCSCGMIGWVGLDRLLYINNPVTGKYIGPFLCMYNVPAEMVYVECGDRILFVIFEIRRYKLTSTIAVRCDRMGFGFGLLDGGGL